jgi:hypothetical protein
MAVIAYPIGVAIVEGAAALWALIVANAVPIAVGTAAVGGAVVLNEKLKDKAAPTTGTTTIVGTKKLNCGDNGNYDDMLKKDGDNKLDRDHVPSKAALQEAARDLIREMRLDPTNPKLTQLFGDKGLISKQGQTIAIPKKDHQQHSRTYGRRNNSDKVSGDSKDLQKAAKDDTDTIEEAEGKEMDDECFGKYKKAADKIRKKTHAEYVKELTDLIKNAIK